MKKITFLILIISAFSMFSCKRQMTCAAYHSYFLLDEESQTHFFNPFGEDSLPKTSQIVNKKGGNGITTGIRPKTYKKYHYFVPMEDVITVEDSVALNDDPTIESDPDGISTSATQTSGQPAQDSIPGTLPYNEGYDEVEDVDYIDDDDNSDIYIDDYEIIDEDE